MRRVDLLIDQARRATENEEVSDLSGISDEEFLQYINDGQDRIQSLIAQTHPDVFLVETEENLVSGQEAYSIPTDALLGNRVSLVEYSDTGNARDYYPLRQGRLSERVSGLSSTPAFYIRRAGQILLQPEPQSSNGKIRINYAQKLPRLDLRRATVSAVTLTSNSITSLTFDTTATLDRDGLLVEEKLSIVNSDGTIQMKAIPFTDINSSSGVVTVDPTFTFESGETIAVGDYAVRGTRATSHSQLADIVERYLIAYMVWKILKRDSSNDAVEQGQELLALQQDIVEFYKEADNDVDYVAILDPFYLDTEVF